MNLLRVFNREIRDWPKGGTSNRTEAFEESNIRKAAQLVLQA